MIENFDSIFEQHTLSPQAKKTIIISLVHSYLIKNSGSSVIALLKLRWEKCATEFNFKETSRHNFFPECMENTFVTY